MPPRAPLQWRRPCWALREKLLAAPARRRVQLGPGAALGLQPSSLWGGLEGRSRTCLRSGFRRQAGGGLEPGWPSASVLEDLVGGLLGFLSAAGAAGDRALSVIQSRTCSRLPVPGAGPATHL